MNKPPIKSEPLLNLSIAERETLIAARQAASTDTRLSPLRQATAAKCVQQLRWIGVGDALSVRGAIGERGPPRRSLA
jgi:hypothetical protein